MLSMVVTLEVSTLSGWLNADALCRVEPRAYEAGRGAGREAGGRWGGTGASNVQARARVQIGRRARVDRTKNMSFICVTLEVSKLSGWLNAVALCRFETRAYEAGQGAGREAGGGRTVGRL